MKQAKFYEGKSLTGVLFLLFIFVSCTNHSNYKNTVSEILIDSIEGNKINDVVSEAKPIVDSIDIDSTAISNIKFCISQIEFNNRKKAFLNAHPNLGNLKIASINGYFYNDSLAGIEIISVRQDAFRNNSKDFVGWEDLFKQKYRGRYDFNTNGYDTSVKNIFVTDVSPKNTPSNDFKELLEKRYSKLSYKTHLPDIKFSGNVEGMMYIGQAFENVKSSRGQQLHERMNREIAEAHGDYFSPTTSIYQKYYDQIRDEANRNIEAHNNSIMNSPSWSIIRIIFKPLKKKYYDDIEKDKKQKKEHNLKDVGII